MSSCPDTRCREPSPPTPGTPTRLQQFGNGNATAMLAFSRLCRVTTIYLIFQRKKSFFYTFLAMPVLVQKLSVPMWIFSPVKTISSEAIWISTMNNKLACIVKNTFGFTILFIFSSNVIDKT